MGMFDRFKNDKDDDSDEYDDNSKLGMQHHSDPEDMEKNVTRSRFYTDYRSYLMEASKRAQENLRKRTELAKASIRPEALSSPVQNIPVSDPADSGSETASKNPDDTGTHDPDTGEPLSDSEDTAPREDHPDDDANETHEHKKHHNPFARIFGSDNEDDEDEDDGDYDEDDDDYI